MVGFVELGYPSGRGLTLFLESRINTPNMRRTKKATIIQSWSKSSFTIVHQFIQLEHESYLSRRSYKA
jgi:hypothetical protein